MIQVFCHKYSFVFFDIIVIRLEAWLTNWLTVNLLKKYKIKSKFTFFQKIPNIFHLVSWKHWYFHSCCAKVWCFQHTWWNIFGIHLKKVNILYMLSRLYLVLFQSNTVNKIDSEHTQDYKRLFLVSEAEILRVTVKRIEVFIFLCWFLAIFG